MVASQSDTESPKVSKEKFETRVVRNNPEDIKNLLEEVSGTVVSDHVIDAVIKALNAVNDGGKAFLVRDIASDNAVWSVGFDPNTDNDPVKIICYGEGRMHLFKISREDGSDAFLVKFMAGLLPVVVIVAANSYLNRAIIYLIKAIGGRRYRNSYTNRASVWLIKKLLSLIAFCENEFSDGETS
ncbi:MAG: hypothetical protein MUD10_04225 [Candidatus Pacebacteria bacterium]|jgi:hypothetical protein|nr:hypothetical protein [Candidatus Paceibacterota bacterium]